MRQRQRWFDGQLVLDPNRLIFIDETWAATNTTLSHGCCPKGQRLRVGFRHGRRKARSPVDDLHMTGSLAPMVRDCPPKWRVVRSLRHQCFVA